MFNIQLSINDLDGSNGFVLTGAGVHDGGIDINGDGIDDLIAGSTVNETISVLFGNAADRTATVDIANLDGSDGFVIDGGTNAGTFPRSAAAGGDFNGDGINDFSISGRTIFTTPAPNNNQTEPGDAIIIFGQAAPTSFGASADATALADVRLTGIDDRDGLGNSMAFANVNGDAFDDLIISAPNREFDAINGVGQVYVVFGGATVTGDIDPAALDGTDGFRLTGIDQFDRAGQQVESVGDFNNDGFSDFAFTTRGETLNGEAEGNTYLIFGTAGGFAAELDLRTLDGSDGVRMFSSDDNETLTFSIGQAGDFNGDGFDDLVLGAPNGESGNTGDFGQISVIFGTDAAQDGAFDIDTLNGSNGFNVFGGRVGDEFGEDIAFGQDFNGDGFADIVVGAPLTDRSGNFVGRGEVSIILGRPEDPTGGAVRTINQIDGNGVIQIGGIATNSLFGTAVSYVGDINGDGFADISAVGRDANGDFGEFIVNGAATLEDGVATTLETDTVAINVFASSTFAPLNARLTEIDGQSVQNGDQVVTADGSTVRVIDAGNGDVEFTPGDDFGVLALGDTDTDEFGFSVGGFADAIIAVTIQGVDSDNDLVSGTNGNDILNGGIGNDQITDDFGADRLNGDAGDDDLTSGRSNDILDGGTGADIMRGGLGNDRYLVDDAADQVIELANEGTDLVEASGAFTFVLPTNVENLNLIGDTDGSGNGADNRINGGAGANIIRGGGGRDIIGGEDGDDILLGQVGDDALRGGAGLDNLQGAEGDDVLFGGDDADTLFGNDDDDQLLGEARDDTLNGGAGNDRLTGGLGADQLRGGAGDDIYVIEDAFDMVTENVGEGIDTVRAGTNIGALADNVENIIAIGDTGRLLTGNDLDNTIFGGDEGDFINGAGGDDLLRGGSGDDVYVFELGDQIIERTGEGTDTILFDSDIANAGDTVFNFNNVEELLIGGSVNVNAIGTRNDERIAGSNGDNIIKGGAGDDFLLERIERQLNH